MTLKNELHSRALLAAKNFKEAEKDLQEILREIDQHKVFYDLGYGSLKDYAMRGLGLTYDVAYNHCTVAQKSQDLPEIRKAVSEGVLSVSAVRQMASVLTKENEREFVELGSRLTQTELMREIARRNPETIEVPERARYVRKDRLALEMRVSEDLMKEFRRVQDLESESQRKFCSLEDALKAAVGAYLEKYDPLKKAARAQKRLEKTAGKTSEKMAEKKAEQTATQEPVLNPLPLEETHDASPRRIIRQTEVNSLQKRRTVIPAAVQHTVTLKLKDQCSHVDAKGVRCTKKRWLHFHHIKPLSEGGDHRAENITLLCSGHHRMIHRLLKTEPRSASS